MGNKSKTKIKKDHPESKQVNQPKKEVASKKRAREEEVAQETKASEQVDLIHLCKTEISDLTMSVKNDSESTTLNVSQFNWTDDLEDASPSDASDEDADTTQSNPTKKHKSLSRRQLEKHISMREKSLLAQRAPESPDEFERMLIGSPNNSYLWIKYMAHMVKVSELDKAREIAERAIKTINFREEGEKLNVWVAWMNLENHFGDQERLDKVYRDAVVRNDPKKVHLQLVKIYQTSSKTEVKHSVLNTWDVI
jgi:rRNA biogenesis protein RRP5